MSAMQESEKAMATHSSTLAWKIQWTEEPGSRSVAAVHGVAKSQTRLSDFTLFFHFHALENPSDGRAWWAAVYGVTQSQTRLKRLSTILFINYIQE